MQKREAAKRVMQEEQHRSLYGFPLTLPLLFIAPRITRAGKCRECHTYEVIRHGYCRACLMPDLIRLQLN